jgi:hypothetical protein
MHIWIIKEKKKKTRNAGNDVEIKKFSYTAGRT